MRRTPGGHPLFTELQVGRLIGWPLVVVTIFAGFGCGLAAIMLAGPGLLTHSAAWLAVPACIPVCFSLVTARSLWKGAVGGLFAALIAFLMLGAYQLWQIACFIITFMGEC